MGPALHREDFLPIGAIIVDRKGFCIHGEDRDPFGLRTYSVLRGDAIETARQWAESVHGYQVVPVFDESIENPEFVDEIDPNTPSFRM